MWKLKYNITGESYEKLWGDSTIETIIVKKNSYVLISVCIWESYNDGTGEWFEIYTINQV